MEKSNFDMGGDKHAAKSLIEVAPPPQREDHINGRFIYKLFEHPSFFTGKFFLKFCADNSTSRVIRFKCSVCRVLHIFVHLYFL